MGIGQSPEHHAVGAVFERRRNVVQEERESRGSQISDRIELLEKARILRRIGIHHAPTGAQGVHEPDAALLGHGYQLSQLIELAPRVGLAPALPVVWVILGRVVVGGETHSSHEPQHVHPVLMRPRWTIETLDHAGLGEARRRLVAALSGAACVRGQYGGREDGSQNLSGYVHVSNDIHHARRALSFCGRSVVHPDWKERPVGQSIPPAAPRSNPPERLLMGPGPSNPDPRVLEAMARPMVGHLDPYFLEVMDETMAMLRGVYLTENHHTIPMSGTGTSGLETIMLNLLEPGDEAVVGVIGYFGQRLHEMAVRAGANVRTIEAPLGEVIPPERFEEELKRQPAKLVALVHAETSTGAAQPIAEVAEIAHRYGALVAVDCVTSLAGMPVDVDGWGIDAAGSCSQKCIGAPPGLGPVTFGPRAMEAVRNRKTPPPTWYLDLNLLFQYWGEDGAKQRVFHHTAPVSSIYAFHEALRLILEEGLEQRWERHSKAHAFFAEGLERLGLSLFTPPEHRLPMLNVVNIPEGVDDAAVRSALLERDIEISGGFGPLKGKTWRVGLMGVNADTQRIERLLGALEEVLEER